MSVLIHFDEAPDGTRRAHINGVAVAIRCVKCAAESDTLTPSCPCCLAEWQTVRVGVPRGLGPPPVRPYVFAGPVFP